MDENLNEEKIKEENHDVEEKNIDTEEKDIDINKKEEDEPSLESLTDERLIECYNEVQSFLKIVEDEIKKTDVGDSDE